MVATGPALVLAAVVAMSAPRESLLLPPADSTEQLLVERYEALITTVPAVVPEVWHLASKPPLSTGLGLSVVPLGVRATGEAHPSANKANKLVAKIRIGGVTVWSFTRPDPASTIGQRVVNNMSR